MWRKCNIGRNTPGAVIAADGMWLCMWRGSSERLEVEAELL